MAYYVATKIHRSEDGNEYRSSMLHEATSQFDLEWLRKTHDCVEKVDGAEAHRWVRNGWPHSTPLYVDFGFGGGRVRKSQDEEN